MPQMSPIYWLILMLYFIVIMMMMIMIINFFYKMKPLMNFSSMNKNKMMNWMW